MAAACHSSNGLYCASGTVYQQPLSIVTQGWLACVTDVGVQTRRRHGANFHNIGLITIALGEREGQFASQCRGPGYWRGGGWHRG